MHLAGSTSLPAESNGFLPQESTSSTSEYTAGQENRQQRTSSETVEPIAIIGIGCRLPGAVNSASKLWEFLRNGKTGQCKVPKNRFNVNAFYHPKGLERPGSMHTMGGYFLQEDPRDFDPEFFGIKPLEAIQMDPQQRKLLEVVFESFESAGVSLDDVSGANIGCYVGNFSYDFPVIQSRDAEYMHRYSATGLGATILSNRVSHTFNLKGPSVVLDTACSSSLYSLHIACSALALRECDSAIVAGTNLIQSPDQLLSIIRAGVLSPTSTCHTFSATADGYARADGVGCLFIKRLSDAIRDKDPIRAVIRGTAVNSNGKTPGITLPSSRGQEAVIRKAYATAGLPFDETSYIECHGTGTPVGDPIEVEGVSQVFLHSRRDRKGEPPLLIGSVKTNLGHSEAASGLTSIMKTVLAMEHEAIPATVGLQTVNPKIKTEEWQVEIVKQLTPWGSTGQLRRAGINSFGYGGANAHVILESADGHLTGRTTDKNCLNETNPRKTYLLPLSAGSPASLKKRVEDLIEYMSTNSVDVANLAYTLSERRTHLSHRTFLLSSQNNLANHGEHADLSSNLPSIAVTNDAARKYVFVFTGQGAQWAEMGKSLFCDYPIFANAISEMDAVLQTLPEHAPKWTLKEIMLEPAATSQIKNASKSQPVCTALQVALVILLHSWGISPTTVVGHSSGEIAAAFATGRVSSAQAIMAAYFRGFAVERLVANGAMIAVGIGSDLANEEIQNASLQGQIRVACVNSPENVTLSGDRDAVDSLTDSFVARKIFARKLNTGGTAYHSHHMVAIGDLYEDLLKAAPHRSSTRLKPSSSVTWVSSVTGEENHNVPDEAYWRANLENPVVFSDAVQKILISEEKYQLIEIGPHSALELPIKQIQKTMKHNTPYASALVRFKDGVESVLQMVGQLYIRHCPIRWTEINKFDAGTQFKVIHDLPPYPWCYETLLWKESRLSSEFRHRRFLRHELLGSAVPAGNGFDRLWRNVLKLGDVAWLESHKLQETIVFPGAGYIAMALEAMRQVMVEDFHSCPLSKFAYALRNVRILAALTISAQPTADVELFTTLRPRQITSTSTSKEWWDFTIISYELGISTTHANGTISSDTKCNSVSSRSKINTDSLESSHPRVWYKNLARTGLNFGPDFQSLQTIEVPSRRNKCVSRVRAPLIQEYKDDFNQYTFHPITLDAMLQATIIASCSGEVQNLQAKVPIGINEILLQTPDKDPRDQSLCHIEATVRATGFGIAEGDAELVSTTNAVLAQMNGIKMVAYNGTAQLDQAETRRHPMLRVLWKPDFYRLSILPPKVLSAAFQQFAMSTAEKINEITEGPLKVEACLDWISHKHPSLRVLELGNKDHLITNKVISILKGDSAFPRLQAFVSGSVSYDGRIHGSKIDIKRGLDGPLGNDALVPILNDERFDVILITSQETSQYYIKTQTELISQHLAPEGGVLISLLGQSSPLQSLDDYFQVTKSDLSLTGGHLVIAFAKNNKVQDALRNMTDLIVVDRGVTILSETIAEQLSKTTGRTVSKLSVDQVNEKTIATGSLVISLLEVEEPVLARSSIQDMEKIKIITSHAAKLLWITSGDLLGGIRPEFAVAFGLSRAVMTEQPSLQWYVFDVDDIAVAPKQTAQNILSVLSARIPLRQDDFEFLQKDGMIYVSRFVPDDNLNQCFRQRQGSELLESVLQQSKPLKLDITEPGNLDTIYFKHTDMPVALAKGEVQISLKMVGLNAKDYYAVGGRTETRDATCTNECCGVVERVGLGVTDLKIGDRVVVMAPGYFCTSEIFPTWACQKLYDHESFDTFCTLPLVYSTALYGLRDRANLQPGERVLIHSGAGGLGIAAIAVARLLGAGEIFVTASGDEKRDYLADILGIKSENIFSSRDASFLPGILKATGGQGVDVVLNSLVGDLLHASWKCCSSFGRFIEVGKRDLVDCGRLEMEEFGKSATFTAFDLSELYYSPSPAHNHKWTELLKDVLQLYRTGQIEEVGRCKIFDVSDITNALRYFSTQNRIGKVVISLENPKTSRVRVQCQKYAAYFSSSKSYVMVGCLGGLGRSISRWMLSRGARKFVFLGRSGSDKPSARQLLADLECQGASCIVVRGDVSVRADVDAMVATVDGKIGGVIQAAMGLREALWSSMTNDDWHCSIQPKLAGTWNLHNAIQGRDDELDFFLMTSSISGSVGTATEANYCAANYFLDVFARHRHSLGLPANAIGLGMISEVGYLHENPEIEALLLRKGIQAINEAELLQIIDIALFNGQSREPKNAQVSRNLDVAADVHILTGLEPVGLKELRKQGWEGILPTLHDPRGQLINSLFDGENAVTSKGHSSRLQADVLQAIQDSGSPTEVILTHITKRFSNLVLLPVEKVDRNKPLSSYGMDSMIAAEFRSWFYQAFQVDVPFLDLMGASSSIQSLAQTIFAEVQHDLL